VAAVENAPPTVQGDRKPRIVTYAIWCFSVSLLIGSAILAFSWGFPVQALLTFLAIGLLIFSSARRHNWARWVLTMITIASFILMWTIIGFQLTYSPLIGAATAIQICLEVIGCTLLFLPLSNRWYHHKF